jgi:hypothetical protein
MVVSWQTIGAVGLFGYLAHEHAAHAAGVYPSTGHVGALL